MCSRRAAPEPIRVAQMVETMTVGGAENLAVRVASALADRGLDSHLIVLTEPGPLSDRIGPDVRVHYLQYQRASVNNPFAFAGSLFRGRKLISGVIAREGIQVVQTHLPGANFWGLLLSLGNVCPVLATIHNNEEFRYGDADNPVRAHLRKRAYQMILRRGAGTVAVSAKVKSSLARTLQVSERDAARIHVVRNGVRIPDPVPEERRQEMRAGLGVDPDTVLILAAGRFGEQKNFGDLVAAAEKLLETGLDFRLLIAGEGEQREELTRRVAARGLADHVDLPGNVADLDRMMPAADVFCMSSLWEGLPLVLLEAMAAGLPTVAYDIAGVGEVIEDGGSGTLVPTRDIGQLAAGLADLIRDPGRRAAMARAARAKVVEEFDFEELVDTLVELYGRVGRTPGQSAG